MAGTSRPRRGTLSGDARGGVQFVAWCAGIGQGVVVRITANASLSSDGRRNAAARAARSAARKATSTVVDLRSAYSISNSASDEPQSKHQYTGFSPR